MGGTTIYEGIQILKYLGFNKIVLVGVDMNYKIHSTAKKLSEYGSEIISSKDDDPNHLTQDILVGKKISSTRRTCN